MLSFYRVNNYHFNFYYIFFKGKKIPFDKVYLVYNDFFVIEYFLEFFSTWFFFRLLGLVV